MSGQIRSGQEADAAGQETRTGRRPGRCGRWALLFGTAAADDNGGPVLPVPGVPLRRVAAVMAASVLGLVTVLAGAASAAPAGGVKGDPQPELKPFKIGTATSAGSVAVEANGDLVVAYDVMSGATGKTFVCVLDRGASTCSESVTLSPLDGDTLFGVPEVFTPSADDIVVLQETCCDSNPNSDLLYTSTDGGATFGAPVRVGSLGVNAAALIGNDIIFSESYTGGAYVESIPVTASGPPASTATATAKAASDIGDGTYAGGALVASDYLSTDYTTYVAFAPSGTNFNKSASYHNVGIFPHEQLIGISGGALLTIQTTGKQDLELRLFNGTGFGSPHVVPSNGGGPGSYVIDQDGNGMVHVFTEDSRSASIYHLYEVSSFSGVTWSTPVDLGDAVQDNSFAVALDSTGSGLVLGTGPAYGYPVLASQSVSFRLASSKIAKGNQTTGSGTGTPAEVGREVELQVEKSGLWYTTQTVHEGAGGSFSFTIKGTTAGSFDYRAVVSDLSGYQMYGYSAAQPLQVTG
jgi:hypothetical protein